METSMSRNRSKDAVDTAGVVNNGAAATPDVARAVVEATSRRWAALVFIALAQLMITLDITIMNIALPSMQQDLDFSNGDRQWIITGYTVAFGSLLLFGGRIADYTGRRRAFLIALLGFAAASAVGGAAGSFEVLLTARIVQGGFGALLAPAALSLLSVTFPDPRERAKAFGVFGGIAAGGGGIGLLTGGLLTDYLDWRWCMYVNVPIALIAVAGGVALLRESRLEERPRFDVLGVLLATAGLVGVVYGCGEAETDGWDSTKVLSCLIAGGVLLLLFLIVESRVKNPLLPLSILFDRTRGSATLAIGATVVGLFGMFLYGTYYMQVVLDYSPIRTGVAFLVLVGGVLISGRGICPRLMTKVPPRVLIVPGMLIVACGLAWMTQVEADTDYASGVMITLILIGFGMGFIMPTSLSYATQGVPDEESGVASATATTGMQIGGSIGTALLNTIAADATADYLTSHAKSPTLPFDALVDGFNTGSAWAAAIVVGGAIVIAFLMNTPKPNPDEFSVHVGGL
jgi:EmrB/QacA subfamily drug resistance transporter